MRQDVNGVMGTSGTGWQRWTYTFTSCPFSGTGALQIVPRFKDHGLPMTQPPTFCIADATLVTHPATLPPVYSSTDTSCAKFEGGPGKFQTTMKISYPPVWTSTDVLQVGTSACMYTFNLSNNYVSMRHRWSNSGTNRAAVYFPAGSLNGLQIKESGTNVCVFSNTNVTVSVQGDSMMLIVPHRQMDLRCEAKMGGKWNRYFSGNVFSVDDDGGFCVNPDIPLGIGLTCSATTVDVPSTPDFLNVYNDTTFVSSSTNLWKLKYTLVQGERLAVGTFPPRQYDWDQSFKSNYGLIQYSPTANPVSAVNALSSNYNLIICWETFMKGAWSAGGECSNSYQIKDPAKLRAYIDAIHGRGWPALLYLSPRFYHSNDMQDFITELGNIRSAYPTLDGVYYDGLPYDWMSAYYVMRKTREMFPNGPIILHASATPPTYMPDLLIPFIDTYADITLRGETVPADGIPAHNQGIAWPFAKYGVSQYNVANCIGIMKALTWDLQIPPSDQLAGTTEIAPFLKSLEYGGRGRRSLSIDATAFDGLYNPIINDLKQDYNNWKLLPQPKADFYSNYYLPKVHIYTDNYLSNIP